MCHYQSSNQVCELNHHSSVHAAKDMQRSKQQEVPSSNTPVQQCTLMRKCWVHAERHTPLRQQKAVNQQSVH